MNGLAGIRVIIVDDEEDEALPILKELSKRGIPAAYFDGSRSTLPTKNQRLYGVRLAILDMDLVGGAVSNKSKISTLLAYLSGLLKPDNGPCGVLVWTKHIDLQQMFEDAVFNEANVPNPIFVIGLDKADCKRANGKFDLKLISSKIEVALAKFSPLLVLQAWEEKCFLAATQVTNELANLAVQNSSDLNDWRSLWKTQFLQLMHAMAVAEAGQQLNSDSCLSALYGSMNPLHADRMESNIPGLCKSLSSYSTEIMKSTATVDIKAKARLNTMLHLAMDGVNSFYAGNIYTQSKLQARIPSVKKLLDDLVMGKDATKKQNKAELAPLVKSVVIEINATCDHAQNNIRIARFIAGLLVPGANIRKIKTADYVHRLGPVFLESKELKAGEYYFFFSARHLLTIELNQVTKATVFARLRGQALSDLQAWFAHRAARPGMLMLTD